MERQFLMPIQLIAEHLDDAWHKAIRACFEYGHEYLVDHGSYAGQKRYGFDYITILIKRPWEEIVPVLPEGSSLSPPSSKEQIETYMVDYLFADDKSDKEDYRYGERIVAPKLRLIRRDSLDKPHNPYQDDCDDIYDMHCNQYNEVVRKYKKGGFGNNQCTIEIAMPNDILLTDPPCCRLIDTRVRYGKLHFIIYFRSWDLYAGFPVNLGGMELLKQMMAGDIGVENGSMIVASKGLHVYEQYYSLVEEGLQMTIKELRERGEEKLKRMFL